MSKRCFDRPKGGYLFHCRYHDHHGGFCNYDGEGPCYPQVVSEIMDRTLARAKGEPVEGEPASTLEQAVSDAVETEFDREFRSRYLTGKEICAVLDGAGFPTLAAMLRRHFE